MKKPNLLKILAFLLVAVSCTEAMAALKMGVFPRRSVEATQKAFAPLAKKLSKELGEKVELVVPESFKAFWMGVKKNKFDIVHYNQYHYIRSHKEMGWQVIVANEEFGKRELAGALSVRKDSGINSVADLKGKLILFGGGKKAMGSYIAPTAILKKAGLVAGKDYLVNFASNPPNALEGVYNHGAGAAGAGNEILKVIGQNEKVNVDEVKIIAESEVFVQLSWAVSPKMSKQMAKKIQKIMTSLKKSDEGKAVLRSAEVTDFYPVSDKDFEKVRKITKYALDEQY